VTSFLLGSPMPNPGLLCSRRLNFHTAMVQGRFTERRNVGIVNLQPRPVEKPPVSRSPQGPEFGSDLTDW